MGGESDDDVCLQFVSENPSIPDANMFIEWMKNITQEANIKGKNITIRVVDELESQTLNEQFRAKDRPTNVLSFASEIPAEIEPDYLGDIVICAPLVEREARQQNKDVQAHWAHLLVHGILHLKGYDHIDLDEAHEMEAQEKNILNALGFSDPY